MRSRKRSPLIRRSSRTDTLLHLALVAAAVTAMLGGCGRYYWGKPGATVGDFDRDSRECAAQAAPASRPGEYAVFVGETYRACLSARGWRRDRQLDPPPAGWYRGYD